jgi:hypothetical protein
MPRKRIALVVATARVGGASYVWYEDDDGDYGEGGKDGSSFLHSIYDSTLASY